MRKQLWLISVVLMLAPSMLRAQETPPPSVASAGAPISINGCTPVLDNNNGTNVSGIQLTAKSNGIQIQFTNESQKTANLINFGVDSNGTSFVIRDVGTFSPGIEIKHRYRNGSGQSFVLPAFIAPQLTCVVDSVHFTDGSVWKRGEAAAAIQTPTPAPAQTLGPSGLMEVTPSRVELPVRGPLQYFMVSTGEKIAGFSERDSCQGIAAITLVVAGSTSATYSVKPVARGSCAATIQDEDSHALNVPITVR